MKKSFLCFVLFIAVALSAFAEITVSYVQDYPLMWSRTNQTGVSYFSGRLLAHLGTLTMTIPKDSNAQSIYITGMGSYTYARVSGMTSYGYEADQDLNLYYVVRVNDSISRSGLIWPGQTDSAVQPISYAGSSLAGKTVTVDYYLRINAGLGYYAENQILTIDTDLGLAKIGVSSSPKPWGVYDQSSRTDLSITTGGYGDDTYEIIGEGASSDTMESGYGNVTPNDNSVTAVMTINKILTEGTLSSIAGTGKTKIADLEIYLDGKKNNYDLSIVFSDEADSKGTEGFTLKSESISTLSVPFQLYLGDDLITKDQAYLGWTGVKKKKEASRAIKVSGIAESASEQLPSGKYSDTISINLTVL
jgi:hypothetical protein